MNKILKTLGVFSFIVGTFSNVYANTDKSFISNYMFTIIVCIAIAIAMTFVYLNAMKEANKNAEKLQAEKMKEESLKKAKKIKK